MTYILPLTFTIERCTYIDPETTPGTRLHETKAVDTLLLCGNLFRAIQQLGNLAQHGCVVFKESDLHETLEGLGLIGQALTQAAIEEAGRINSPAEKGKGTQDRSDGQAGA